MHLMAHDSFRRYIRERVRARRDHAKRWCDVRAGKRSFQNYYLCHRKLLEGFWGRRASRMFGLSLSELLVVSLPHRRVSDNIVFPNNFIASNFGFCNIVSCIYTSFFSLYRYIRFYHPPVDIPYVIFRALLTVRISLSHYPHHVR